MIVANDVNALFEAAQERGQKLVTEYNATREKLQELEKAVLQAQGEFKAYSDMMQSTEDDPISDSDD